MRTKLSFGFTLLELITTLAISAITLGLALPMMGGIINSNRTTGQINELRGALALTRSEAIKRNQHVVLCKSADGQSCTREGTWRNGWIVFVDTNHSRARDKDENILLVHEKLPDGHELEYHGFASHDYVAYRPTGITKTNGTFTLCSSYSPERSKSLILMKTGRVRLSTTKADGSPLDCGKSTKSTG